MASRRGENRIRGPQSALTDFLATHNISAQQIRDDYQRRRAQADAQATAENGENEEDNEEEQAAAEAAIQRSKRRREIQEETVAKIKKTKDKNRKKGKEPVKDKKKKKGKKKVIKGSEDDEDVEMSAASDASAEFKGYRKAVRLPGQLENCEVCEKRFTVTPYSKAGPGGGLLCTPCGKEMSREVDKVAKATKKVAPQGRKRRKIESDKLDGKISLGAKTLQQLCIETAANYAGDMEDLGDMPQRMIDRLSEIFTKKRVMKSHTLPLFLKPDNEAVVIHDCAYLDHSNFTQIFAICTNIQKLVLGNACQFKDQSMQYMIEKASNIRWLHLYAANLITNPVWSRCFIEKGAWLEALQLTDLDTYFENEQVLELAVKCPKLNRLKLKRCRRLTPDCLDAISQISTLQHLSLQFSTGVQIPNDKLANMVTALGPNLRTLSLEDFTDADDSILDTIATSCTRLEKLRLSTNDTTSDAAWASLFSDWRNPPLRFVDLSRTRDVDNSNPNGPEGEAIGIAGGAFTALMRHSGAKMEYLRISSCRHISYEALCEVFDGANGYPELLEVDMSFVTNVDTLVLAGLFKSAPRLRKVVAFGCVAIEDVIVPQGMVLIGVPKAQDAIEQFGVVGVDVEGALGGMLASASLEVVVGA